MTRGRVSHVKMRYVEGTLNYRNIRATLNFV